VGLDETGLNASVSRNFILDALPLFAVAIATFPVSALIGFYCYCDIYNRHKQSERQTKHQYFAGHCCLFSWYIMHLSHIQPFS
jgi:hypothetical protein